MELEKQIDLILKDSFINDYFKEKSLYEFIKLYIEIDKILANKICNELNSNIIINKLDDIKGSIHNIKDITINDIKTMFLDLQTKLINGFDTQNIRILLENFKDKIENINIQKLNDIDKKSLDLLTTLHTNIMTSFDSHPITNKIAIIESNITNINEHFSSNSSKKGQVAENVLYNLLSTTFSDTEIVNTSCIANSGDLQMIKDQFPKILIDSKNFNTAVPKRDIDKFYSDIQTNNCCGILCNSFYGISNKQHFEIDIVDGKNILIFIHAHKFDDSVFKLAVSIIYNMYDKLKESNCDSIIIEDKNFQNLKIEYNYYIQTYRHHLDIIKSNINSLSQLSFTLLDSFFKRKTLITPNQDIKNVICSECNNYFSSQKTLRVHIKNKHPDIKLDRKIKGRPIKEI